MKKNNIAQIIKELAKENFGMYSECYPTENGLATQECAENILTLAQAYYNERNEHEIQRDAENGVSLEDYAIWCQEAFENFLNEK